MLSSISGAEKENPRARNIHITSSPPHNEMRKRRLNLQLSLACAAQKEKLCACYNLQFTHPCGNLLQHSSSSQHKVMLFSLENEIIQRARINIVFAININVRYYGNCSFHYCTIFKNELRLLFLIQHVPNTVICTKMILGSITKILGKINGKLF